MKRPSAICTVSSQPRLTLPTLYNHQRALWIRFDAATGRRQLRSVEKYGGNGGAGGIRTLDTVLPYTHFPGERLRPLGHRSAYRWKRGPLGKLTRLGKL